jgi:hypothetical protein
MNQTTTLSGIGLLTLLALSACASQGPPEAQTNRVEQCSYPHTMTCDQFAGEDYNCSCERGATVGDIIDSY